MTRSTWNPNSPGALGLEFLGVGVASYSFPSTATVVQRGLAFRAQRTGPIDKVTVHSGPGTSVPTLSSSLFAGHRLPYVAELIRRDELDTGGSHTITTLTSSIVAGSTGFAHYPGGGSPQAGDLASADTTGVNPTLSSGKLFVHFPTASDFPLDRQVISVAVEWSAFASNLRARRRGDRNVVPVLGGGGDVVTWSRVLAGGTANWHLGELWVEGGDTATWHEVTPQTIREFDSAIGNRRMELQVVTFNPSFAYDLFRLHIDSLPERRIGTGVVEVASGVANQRDVLVEIPFHAPGATGTPVQLVAGEEYVLVIRNPYGGSNDYSSSSTLQLRNVADQKDASGTFVHFDSLDWDWHDVTTAPGGSGVSGLGAQLTGLPTALFSVTGAPTVDSQPYTRTVGGRASQAAGEVLRQHNVPNPSPAAEYRSIRFNVSVGQPVGGGTGSVPQDPLQVSFTQPGLDEPFLGPFSIAPEDVLALGTTQNVDEFGHMYFPVTVDFGEGVTFPGLFDVVFRSVASASRPWRVATLQSLAAVGGDQTYGAGFQNYSAAAPVVTGAVFTAFAPAATGHAANLPAVVDPGDLLFAFAGWENGDAVTTQTPAGWTKLSSGSLGPVIFVRDADGSEDGGTVDLTTTTNVTGVAVTCRVTGAHSGGFAEAVALAAARANAAGTEPNPPSANQPGDWFTAPVRVLAVADWIDDDVALTLNPAGYTALASGVSGGGVNNGVGIAVAHRAVATPSEDPGPFTIAASQPWAAHTLLVRPTPDGGGTPGSFASGRALFPVGGLVQDLNVTTLDDLEFTLFTQAPEVTGLDVSVLQREAHGATCQPDPSAPTPDTLVETFNKADGPLGPDLTWSREVYDHEFVQVVASQRARYRVDEPGTWEDVQVPTPNFTQPDVRVELDLTSLAVTGSPVTGVDEYQASTGVVTRARLLGDGDDYTGYAAVVGRDRRFASPTEQWHLALYRVDGRESQVLLDLATLPLGSITLPGTLTLTSVGQSHTARFTHAGSGAALEVSATDDTYRGGVTFLRPRVFHALDGRVSQLEYDQFELFELATGECSTCRAPRVTYPRVCWAPTQLPVEDFTHFELQRQEPGGVFETVAVLEKQDTMVTAVGAAQDEDDPFTDHPAPSLVAVGDELLFCWWHSWQTGDYSVSGTGMNPLGTALALQFNVGQGARAPDRPELHTSTFDVRLKLSTSDWTPGGFGTVLVGQFPNVAGQNGWFIGVGAAGELLFLYSVNGTTMVPKISTVPLGFVDGTVHHVRVTFVGDDGAGQNVTRFFTSEDGVTWTPLGATITTAGVATVFNATGPLQVGDTLPVAATGQVYYVEVRTEVDGPVVTRADFHSLLPGTTVFEDDHDNTWTVYGAASVVAANELTGAFGGGADSSSVAAWQQVPAGATGTRVAEVSPARNFATMSVLVRGVEGPPVLEEVVTNLGLDGVTLTTSPTVKRGMWLLALFGSPAGSTEFNGETWGPPTPGNWEWQHFDPGFVVTGPTGITDSHPNGTAADRPRVSAWIRPVVDDGPQTVTLPQTSDPFDPWDYHFRVVVLSNVAEFIPSCYDDWSVAYGGEVCYRVRQGRSDGSISDFSAPVCETVPGPAGVDLVFTVPSRPELNAAYNEAHAGLPTEREYTFLDAGDTVHMAVYGRDNQLAFRPTEKRGVRFRRNLLVSPLCEAEVPCLDAVKPLRDLMTEPVPIVVARDTCGNRWYASVVVDTAVQLSSPGLPDLWTAQVTIVELAAPVVGEAMPVEAHSELA